MTDSIDLKTATGATGLDEFETALTGVVKAVQAGMSASEMKDSFIKGSGSAFVKLRQAENRRVDVVMLGDSNQQKDGYGFTKAIDEFLSGKFGQYASPIYDTKSVSLYQGLYKQSGQYLSSKLTGDVEDEHSDMYLNALSTSDDVSLNSGIIIGSEVNKFDVTSALRVWCRYGGYPTGTGSFYFTARKEESPYTSYSIGSDTFSTNTGEYSYEMAHCDIDAGVVDNDANFKVGFAGSVAVAAPMTFFYYRLEDVAKNNGVSCHTLYAGGGQSLWDFATTINEYSDNQLSAFFEETRRLQKAKGQDPIVVIYINSGLNDRNETEVGSLGAYGFDDNTSADGYIDNLTALIDRFEDIWSINGWPQSELHFLCIGSHVIADDPNDVELTSYRDALTTLASARSNLTTVDLSDLMTYAEATENDWYLSQVELEHLNENGYDEVTALIFNEL